MYWIVLIIMVIAVIVITKIVFLLQHQAQVLAILAKGGWWIDAHVAIETGLKSRDAKLLLELLEEKGTVESRTHSRSRGEVIEADLREMFGSEVDVRFLEIPPEFYSYYPKEYRLARQGPRLPTKKSFLDLELSSPVPLGA